MPDFISIPAQNILPVWDSFEAAFFVFSGVSVGFVFGYLFPSIWRTIRRRFRPHGQYIISDISLERNLQPYISIADDYSKKDLEQYSLIELFVIARDLFQKKEFRQAIKIYGEILTSAQASTPHIHRALFELAQVYFALNLDGRAFDTAFELLQKKPRDIAVLKLILDILNKHFLYERLKEVLSIYKAPLNDQTKNRMSFLVSKHAEKFLETDVERAILLSKFALQISTDFGYAQFVLWQGLSLRTRQKKPLETSSKWIAFAGDLFTGVNICKTHFISPSAISPYISRLLSQLFEADSNLKAYNVIKTEFRNSFKFSQITQLSQKIIFQILLESLIFKKEEYSPEKYSSYQTFMQTILAGSEQIFLALDQFFLFSKDNIFVNEILNPDVINIGLQEHRCKNCKSVFTKFQWSCGVCGSLESLNVFLPPFTEHAFHDQNWYPHQDNRNRRADSHFNS